MRFGGIVLVVLLTLGACSSDPEPKEPRRTTTSTAPTATPPTMPAQAKQDTPEGAAAFVKHYIDVFNYASNTGDVDELSAGPPGESDEAELTEGNILRAVREIGLPSLEVQIQPGEETLVNIDTLFYEVPYRT